MRAGLCAVTLAQLCASAAALRLSSAAAQRCRTTATSSRREAASLLGAVALAAALPPRRALADDELAVAYFSAGDPRFLQPKFDEIFYMGVKAAEVGSLGSEPAIRITYNAKKVSFKRVLGNFWRSCDPTSVAQFGDPGPTIIWVAGEDERKVAEESRRRLQLSTQYSSPTFGPSFKGRPIQTEIRALEGEWTPAPDADQSWYQKDEKAYEKLRKKTGRTKWFEEAFKPVTVTACEKNEDGSRGTVCGYVYFPCSEDNGCSFVTSGNF